MRRWLWQRVATAMDALRRPADIAALERLDDRHLADLGLTRADLPLLQARARAERRAERLRPDVSVPQGGVADGEWARCG